MPQTKLTPVQRVSLTTEEIEAAVESLEYTKNTTGLTTAGTSALNKLDLVLYKLGRGIQRPAYVNKGVKAASAVNLSNLGVETDSIEYVSLNGTEEQKNACEACMQDYMSQVGENPVMKDWREFLSFKNILEIQHEFSDAELFKSLGG